MTSSPVIQHDKNNRKLHKWSGRWFGANRGTHWTIAGSVAVIILGGYVIYNNRNSGPMTATTTATEPTSAPTAPAPLRSEK
jgi:hypothetical protein